MKEKERKKSFRYYNNKKDLIWLKNARDSKQDQADIEKLKDDKD
jgi:hypothetical protein